ncbi:MAG: hypothetical protein WCW25_03705 [Patescibacteria group bacterium]
MDNLLKNIFSFAKGHYLALILGFLLTLIIFAPLLAFPWILGKEYKGININAFGTDAHFYLTRGKEVLEGHSLGSAVTREGKNEKDLYLSYSDYILLAPVKLLGFGQSVNIVTLYNIYNFIGIFVLILLIYFFSLGMSGNKLLSLAAAIFTVGGYSIVYNKALFYNSFNIYARVLYPYFSSLVLFLYLNFLVRSFNSFGLKYKIYSALVFGAMFYTYFYGWSFILILNGCLFLIYLLKKDYAGLKKILFISLFGLAIGAYNLIRLFDIMISKTEMDRQIAYFSWMSLGHAPIFSKIGFGALVLFLIFWYKRRNDKNTPLIFAIILAGWVALNQQIITGRMLQYGHFYWYFIVPLSIVIGFYMFERLVNWEKLKFYALVSLIGIAFLNTTVGQYRSFFTTLKPKRYEQKYRPFIDYLNKVADPTVIFAEQTDNYLFTIYTPHDLLWNQIVTISRVPIDRFKDTLFIYYYLNKDSRNNFQEYLSQMAGDNRARGNYYQVLYRNLEGYWSGYDFYAYQKKLVKSDAELASKRPEVIAQLAKEYEEAVKGGGINKIFNKYGVKYLFWDKNNNPEWDLSGIKGLKEVVAHNNIYLYELN